MEVRVIVAEQYTCGNGSNGNGEQSGSDVVVLVVLAVVVAVVVCCFADT